MVLGGSKSKKAKGKDFHITGLGDFMAIDYGKSSNTVDASTEDREVSVYADIDHFGVFTELLNKGMVDERLVCFYVSSSVIKGVINGKLVDFCDETAIFPAFLSLASEGETGLEFSFLPKYSFKYDVIHGTALYTSLPADHDAVCGLLVKRKINIMKSLREWFLEYQLDAKI